MGSNISPLQALPDNLKLLFRPVAMTTPEFGLIAEVFLYSVGFIKVIKMSGRRGLLVFAPS